MSSETDRRLRRRIPIRWRLAAASSALTFLILVVFAIGFGSFMTDRLRSDFDRETVSAAETLVSSIEIAATPNGFVVRGVDVNDYAGSQKARIRILDLGGDVIASSVGAPDFGILPPGETQRSGHLIVTRPVNTGQLGQVLLQYARPSRDLTRAVGSVWIALAIGVVAGSMLALLVALAIAKRTLRPLGDLTEAARQVERTGDATVAIPVPPANDEVRDLAVTLGHALSQLDSAKVRTENALERQREFVADASHELRTPLTALLANLELLAAETEGDAHEDAEAALRSGRRMSALVADLLLLARADGARPAQEVVDLAETVRAASEELSPLLEARSLTVDANETSVNGDSQALLRAVRNLIGNAIVHTPDATEIRVQCQATQDGVLVAVDDSGTGVPPERREHIFERFVSSAGDGNRGTGLGLAIVATVAESHGGSVRVTDSKLGGARFELRLPAA